MSAGAGDIISGNWKAIRGKVKQQWGKLTDDDLDVIDGRREELLGRLQARYGESKERAEEMLNEFENGLT